MIDTNINETNILQKCSKCRKLMPINQFVNKQNRILKTCNLCCQQSLIYYKESTDHDEKEILLPKIMAKRLFDEVNIIGPMKILKMNKLELTLRCDPPMIGSKLLYKFGAGLL